VIYLPKTIAIKYLESVVSEDNTKAVEVFKENGRSSVKIIEVKKQAAKLEG